MALSTFLTNLVIPLNLGVTLLVLGVLCSMLRRPRLGALITVSGVAWVLFWSLPASTLWAGGHLEQRYPYRPPDQLPVAEAIVVLGGSTASNRANWFEPYDRQRTISRVDTAAELYHAGRAPHVVVSGAALDGNVSESQIMANNLRQLGVPSEVIIQESESLTTYENAVYTARLLKELQLDRVLLVTSALHMPRAMGVFRKQQVDAIAAGSPPQITVPEDTTFLFWQPNAHVLSASRSIVKEYVGMLVYWLRGWL
ncbi:ElyC/SanA/YdcF family protein [Yanghanlia caeni]|uniref:YdcF family protein n=1 Tax=Yanghanlia caeni TaxID=3064283 RepID=A0ABU1D6C5_9BURK|nr:YdcF family protein [Alcaligenaceae bacterium LG-2]NGR08117.1 YdcF family protein [bacterium SGD-2]HZH57937.1 YdcF family protein [Burkholderiaceae bacterium]